MKIYPTVFIAKMKRSTPPTTSKAIAMIFDISKLLHFSYIFMCKFISSKSFRNTRNSFNNDRLGMICICIVAKQTVVKLLSTLSTLLIVMSFDTIYATRERTFTYNLSS